MRSVFIHLRETTEGEVAIFLQRIYTFQTGPPWVLTLNGDPCLWIDFYRDASREFEPKDWARLVKALGCEPVVSLVVEVSGRHPGDDQVRSVIATTLGEFQGVAQDDFTTRFWTAEEVLSGYRENGHLFFDYSGWFKEEADV